MSIFKTTILSSLPPDSLNNCAIDLWYYFVKEFTYYEKMGCVYKSSFRPLPKVVWGVAGVLKKRASAKIFFERMPEREGWAQ